jgi:hypothetical protein
VHAKHAQTAYEDHDHAIDPAVHLGPDGGSLQPGLRNSIHSWSSTRSWFITPNVLAELEFVNQKHFDFPTTDIRNGGEFKGFMVEGVVAF